MTINHIIPKSQHGYSFSGSAIANKQNLNAEFMNTPINSNVAILWYHRVIASHAALSIDGKPFGFAYGFSTYEAPRLEGSIEKRKRGDGGIFSQSMTVQHLKITPLKKRKLEKIAEKKRFACLTCMHAVSRILAKITDIKIPWEISQLPDASLGYLNDLQRFEDRHLMKQITYGKQGTILNNPIFLDSVTRGFLFSNLIAGLATSLISTSLYYMGYEMSTLGFNVTYVPILFLTIAKTEQARYKMLDF